MAVVINGTTGVSGVDGSASTPAYQGTDSNTGITFPAADTVAVATGGSERVRVDSSGNVGIGTSSPVAAVQLQRGASTAAYYAVASNNTALGTSGLLLGQDASGLTRIYQYGANAITLWTNDTERMRITSAGNVGIGTSSPSAELHVYGSAELLRLQRNSNATGNYVLFATETGGDQAYLGYSDAGVSDFAIFNVANGYVRFGTNNTERARITSGGNLLVGITDIFANGGYNTSHTIVNSGSDIWCGAFRNSSASNPRGVVINYSGAAPNNTGQEFLWCTDSGALRASIRSNGGIANYSANDVNLASDQRLKKDISPLATSWDKVKAIEVVNFRYKDCNEDDPLLYGVIAQQVQPIVPELVVVTREAKEAIEAKEAVLDEEGNVVEPAVAAKEATPEYFGIREQPMYWLAIKALQEAMTRIETLEAQNAAFEVRLAALENK